MSRILVTGVNGFVGQHLVKELVDNNISVVGVGGPNIDNEKPLNIDTYLNIDLTKPEGLRGIDFKELDGVIHLAGLAAVGPSFADPMRYITSNVGIETNLFEAALNQKAFPMFLIISSGSLYDPQAGLPITEASPVSPSSPYAVSKIGQEQMARYYQSRGFKIIIARPFNHIGPGQNEGFILPDLTKQIIAFEKGLTKEVLVGNLDAKRDYTDVRDIVRAYRLLIEKGVPGEIYNICSGHARSGHEILEKLMTVAGVSLKVTQDTAKMRPSDSPQLYGSHDKLTAATGWQPEIALEVTLADVIADWRSRI